MDFVVLDEQSIAGMVTSVAMEAYAQNDYAFIPTLELYYQQQSGYFYKQGINDFYHAATQYAYHFDSTTNQYEWIYDPGWSEKIGCRVDLDVFLMIESLLDRVDKVESGEIESDPDDETDDYPDEYKEYLQLKAQEDEIDPCIRLVDRLSNFFSIVTVQGAAIGPSSACDIQVPVDLKSDENICSINFDQKSKTYNLIFNSSSSINIALNGNTLTSVQNICALNHRDILVIGSHCFDLHIHKGLNTCAECEPGLKSLVPSASSDQIVHLSKTQKEKLRRKELKNLKAQYGLSNDVFTNQFPIHEQKYVDRANIRRKVVGSDHSMISNCKPIETASVTKPISDKNVGFKMLSRMGWKEGQSLGSKEQNPSALNEPLLPIIRVGMSGLGSENSTITPSPQNEDVAAKKLKIIKMKQRYDKTKLINFFDEEDP